MSVSHPTAERQHVRAWNAHVDLDNVDHVLVRQVLEVHRLVVALADIVDFSHAGARPFVSLALEEGHSRRNRLTEHSDVELVEDSLELGVVGVVSGKVDRVDLRLDVRVLGG